MTSIRLFSRIKPPIFRWDIWPFVLVLYPLLTYLTLTTWDRWHPTAAEVLGHLSLFTRMKPATHTPYIKWIYDAIDTLPPGVPGLWPAEQLPVALAEPLLQSNNFALILFAGWGLVISLNVLAFLMPHWSLQYKSKCLYKEVTRIEDATHVLVASNSKQSEFCRLEEGFRLGKDNALTKSKMIAYLKKKFSVVYADQVTFDDDPKMIKRLNKYKSEGLCSSRSVALVPPQYDMNRHISFYQAKLEGPGIKTRSEYEERKIVFGKNEQEIPIPSFLELFGEHARAPLFVFQVFCQVLWLIDEYWQFSMMSLGFLAVFEGQIVHRRRKDLNMIQGMHMPPIPVAVKRHNKWWATSSVDLVPGDIFSLAMANDLKTLPVYPNSSNISQARFTGEEQSISVPCDALLLQGSAVVNEAMLTGESLPQMKAPLDFTSDHTVDIAGKNKNAVLSAGTSVILESSGLPKDDKDDIGGAICYCLKTGFQTTQGKLIRTVLYSSERATVATKEAMYFLLVLLIVAIFASAYVLAVSWGLPNRNHFKLLLHCIMIITAVVPPELPVTMSMTVTLALAGLFKKKLYCTEPFRIPLAGKLTVCCFDKTGTLTSSEVILESVTGIPKTKDIMTMSPQDLDDPKNFALSSHSIPDSLPATTQAVMGFCHSLVAIPKKRQLPLAMRAGQNQPQEVQILGDPLEKAALLVSGCEPMVGDTSNIKTSRGSQAVVLRRFAFESEQQRMTSVIRDGDKAYVVCKGASERIASLIDHVPSWYQGVVSDLSLQGRRVLAMAAREWDQSDAEARKAPRSEIESHLKFVGLLVFGCPIKEKTVETLQILRKCGHRLVMITGDDPRTAAHVALETELCPQRKNIYFVEGLERSSDKYILNVKSRDGKIAHTLTFTIEVDEKNVLIDKPCLATDWFFENALVVTGKNLIDIGNDSKLLAWIISRTCVFARVTPKDKEVIVQVLNNHCGETSLMCGDGTNDVGALKIANVGISLLNFDIDKIKKNKKSQIDKIQKTADIVETTQQARKRRLDLGLTNRQITTLEKMEQNLEIQARGLALFSDNLRNKFLKTLRTNIANAEERFAQDNLARAAGHHPTSGSSMAQQMQTQMEDEMPMLKPGDASMASPFTYRGQNIKCVKLLVRSGKGTLATVMMMYKLMALNSLTTAFALSVLTLNGVKMGDGQSTVESLFISVLFMAASNAKCAKQVTRDRVIDSLFDKFFFMSIILQASVHIATYSIAWYMASFFMPAYQEMDGPFKPNLVNTVIYLVSAAQHAASFTANYEGSPFLISMADNKVLNKGLMIFVAALFCITAEMFPFLNHALKLVPFPTPAFRYAMVALIGLDISLATFIGNTCTQWGRQRITESLRG